MEETKEELNFITHAISDAEKCLGIPRHAIMSLISKDEDDWSFIIKLSAIVEQLLNYVLLQNIEAEAIKKLVQSQGLSRKVDLAKELMVIDDDIAKKLKLIGILRNDAAHNFTFKFFPSEERFNSYKSIFANTWVDGVEIQGEKTTSKALTAENPKLTLFLDCLGCLSMMSLNQSHATWLKEHKRESEIMDAQEDIIRAFFKGFRDEE